MTNTPNTSAGKTRIAINGFGRIGRMILRAYFENQMPKSRRDELEIVAINDLAPVETNAHLLKYDSVHGQFSYDVETSPDTMTIDGQTIKVLSNPNPEDLPWGDMDIDIVFECSGRFTARDDAAKHLTAGAKRVLVSAPAKGADLTVVYGVNDEAIGPEHEVISNASCTTNCLAPMASALHKAIGIERGFMTTIHSYTGDQRLVDTMHGKDPYRARAAAMNMIPTSTGAAKAVGLVLPELNGKLDGTAIRVTTPNVSLVDLTFTASRPTTAEEVNQVVTDGQKDLKGALAVNTDPLVSMDFNHNPHSSIFDATQTAVTDGTFVRVMSWYDNEWGFSCRMLDTATVIAATLGAAQPEKIAC